MESIEFTSPFYLQSWHHLIKYRNFGKREEETTKIFVEFAKEYTLLSCCWFQVLRLTRKDLLCYYSQNFDKNIDWTGYENNVDLLGFPYVKNKLKIAEEGLSFPHRYLNQILLSYYENGDKPVTVAMIEKVEKHKNLYKKMKENKQNIDLWIECLKEIENKDAVIANLELLLWQFSESPKLWNAYISYLEKLDLKEILKYYRNCFFYFECSREDYFPRIFIRDMREKETIILYFNEMKDFILKNELTTKWWINLLKHDMDFSVLKIMCLSYLERPLHFGNKVKKFSFSTGQTKAIKCCVTPEPPLTTSTPKKTTVCFDDQPQNQQFSFQQTFIRYLLKTANGFILRKLYASCKFLFSLQKTPLCYKLDIYAKYFETYFCEESLYLSENDINFHGLKNLHIYDKLYCQELENRNFLSTIIPKLYRCSARYITIKSQDLTVAEFKFLLSENCYFVKFLDINVYENHFLVGSEKILQIFKSFSSLKVFEFVNDYHLFCCGNKSVSKMIDEIRVDILGLNFETIYLENVKSSKSDFCKLLQSSNRLKSVKLEDTVIMDENECQISSNEMDELVKIFLAMPLHID